MIGKKKLQKKLVFVVLGLVIVVLLSTSVFFYYRYQATKKLLRTPAQVIQEDKSKLLKEVEALIELPKGEDPIVATVTDKRKVKDQPFFAKAENGDRVIIYPKAKKAVLYRPSTKKIIEFSPVNIGAAIQSSLTPTATEKPTVKVVILNGTKTAGLAQRIKEKIGAEMADLEVVATGNSRGDYTENLIIDLKGDQTEVVTRLTQLLSAKTSTLPEEETAPDADILVILGK